MRERVEDLGRLTVMLSKLLDHELFKEEFRPGRPKDYWEWFESLSDEKKEETLNSWVYSISSLQEEVYEMLEIAKGEDLLNQSSK